jgi:hypothetical protein
MKNAGLGSDVVVRMKGGCLVLNNSGFFDIYQVDLVGSGRLLSPTYYKFDEATVEISTQKSKSPNYIQRGGNYSSNSSNNIVDDSPYLKKY